MGVVRQFPYAHWISYICSMIVPAESPVSAVYRQDEAPRFPVYHPTAPQDRRRGRQAERAAMAQLSPEAQARVAQEDETLLVAEAQLPGGMMRFTGLSLSQTPPRMPSTFLQHPPVTTTRQEGPESQLQSHRQLLLLQSLR